VTDISAGPTGDLDPETIRAELRRIADWAAEYRTGIESRDVSQPVAPGEIAQALRAIDWEKPVSLDTIVADLDTIVMPGILHWGHPAFLGYFGSTSNTPALVGEIAAAALNVSAMTWKSSPSATEMESVVLEWIRSMCSVPSKHMGIVYDTASVGVMHALAAAREKKLPGVRKTGLTARPEAKALRIYASDQAHSSAEKAAIALGIGEQNVVRVASDEMYRLDARALRRRIEEDVRAGLTPLAVIATVGTTSTASVDPIPAIAEICREFQLWLHVDAAYGGAYAVLPEGRWVTEGFAFADSIVINPHKWLFVPLDFSVLFVKDPKALRDVFSLTPEYLRGAATDSPQPDYMDYGIQLGRRFRALKAWMVLRSFGRSGIESRIRENCRAAELMARLISEEMDFHLATKVNMAIVCFRYEPRGRDPETLNRINQQIVEKINASGKAFLTYTILRGKTCIRAGFGNLLTTDDHIEAVWELVQAHAHAIE
jgi:aromatic-L-amino-acid decarboxylase